MRVAGDLLGGALQDAGRHLAVATSVLAAVPADPWRACRMAASLGGDCDTIAAMTGAVAGACHGAGSFPPQALGIPKIHEHRINGLGACGRGSEKREVARQAVDRAPGASVGLAVGARPQRRGQVLGPPGQPLQPRACTDTC